MHRAEVPFHSTPTLADHLWLGAAQAHGASHWLSNSKARVTAFGIGEHDWPVTLTDGSHRLESYVANLRSAWVRYAADEARRLLPPWQARLAQPALATFDMAWARGAIDRAAIVGNALVSTNLYPNWIDTDLEEATEALVAQHPQRLLALRNVCGAVNPRLPPLLSAAGWHLIPARQVYLCDPSRPGLWRHNHVKRDQRLLDDPVIEAVHHDHITPQDLPALRACFRQLFIDKHSALNPDFTDAFFRFCLDSRWLQLWMLRAQGRPVGVLGLYARHGWITTPLIGYDTTAPVSWGLYRRLMALLLREARDQQLKLHYSSGAGDFKTHRGGEPALEYTAVYDRHLPAAARLRHRAGAAMLVRHAPALLAANG